VRVPEEFFGDLLEDTGIIDGEEAGLLMSLFE